ncbi:hypothetical protein [Lactococcus petauri]|uniref:hypothetical protein n=1 Tax=Lactococcus petauri TaxID=1940789 RepID=UPI0022E3BE27|nr:hypothetical protein [Lactococcus petauri]
MPNSTWNLGQGDWNIGFNGRYEILPPEADKPNAHILHGLPLTSGTQQVTHLPHPVKVTTGQVITVSFDYKDKNWTKNTTFANARIFPAPDTTNGSANALQQVSFTSDSEKVKEVDEWVRFYKTFTVEHDGYLELIPTDNDTTGNHESFYRMMKVELSDKATTWIPAESDLT